MVLISEPFKTVNNPKSKVNYLFQSFDFQTLFLCNCLEGFFVNYSKHSPLGIQKTGGSDKYRKTWSPKTNPLFLIAVGNSFGRLNVYFLITFPISSVNINIL